MDEAMGNDAPDLSTIKDKEGMTIFEREAMAEKNFNKIKERILARQGINKYDLNKDFIESNIVAHEDQKMGP